MTRPLIFAVLLLACAPASAADRNFGVSGFDQVRVDGPFRVRLTTGVPPFAKVSGSPAAIDRVAIDVIGKTLVVHTSRSSWGGYPGAAVGPVEITIGTHDLARAWLNGSGALDINKVRGLSFDLSVQGSGSASIGAVDVDQFKLGMSGSASARLAGKAPKLNAIVRGTSALDAAALSVKDAVLAADGPATIKGNVSGTAKVDVYGTSAVELAGKPACTVRSSGSASVIGCR